MKKREGTLFRSTSVVGFFIVLSRITGFLRDRLISHLIGANAITDALTLSIKLPSFFRRMFAEGALHVSFLPMFANLLGDKEERRKDAFDFAGYVLFLMITGLLVCILLAEIFFPYCAAYWAPKYAEKKEMLVLFSRFVRITLPFIFFISVASFFGGILNTFGHFNVWAASQALGNTFVVCGAYIAAKFLKPFLALFGSTWSCDIGSIFPWVILLSGVVQFVFVFSDCLRKGLLVRPQWPSWRPEIKKFFLKFGAGALGVGVVQINIMISAGLAVLLPDGSVTYLSYSDRINQLPLAIIGISLSMTLLPTLSRKLKHQDIAGANKTQNQSVRFASCLAFASGAFFIVAASPIVDVLFGNSQLTPHALWEISKTVMACGVGVPAFVLIKILSARFFAAGNTNVPFVAAAVALCVDVVLGIALLWPLQCPGLMLASSLSAWANVTVLSLLPKFLENVQPASIMGKVCARVFPSIQSREERWVPNVFFWTFIKRLLVTCSFTGGIVVTVRAILDSGSFVPLFRFLLSFANTMLDTTGIVLFLAQSAFLCLLFGVGAFSFVRIGLLFRLFSRAQLRIVKNSLFKRVPKGVSSVPQPALAIQEKS